MIMFLSLSCLKLGTSTFWASTQLLLGTQRATMPHFKEDTQSVHMTSNTQIVISEITLFEVLFTSYWGNPRISFSAPLSHSLG